MREGSPPPTTCHMTMSLVTYHMTLSLVPYHMSCITYIFLFFFLLLLFLDKRVEQIGGGSVINGAYTV